MTTAAAIFASLLTAALVWRGYRSGAVALLIRAMRWAVGLCIAAGAAWLLWRIGQSVVAGVAFALVVILMPRLSRRRIRAPAWVAPGWGRRCDRWAGAGLGLLAANAVCLALALLGGTLALGETVERLAERDHVKLDEAKRVDAKPGPPVWVKGVGASSEVFAHFAGMGPLDRVPRVGRIRREFEACLTLLNAPEERVRYLVNKRELLRFADDPAVAAALDDPSYTSWITRARDGDLAAFHALAESDRTHAILASPAVRDFARSVTPSQLVAEMNASPPQRTEPKNDRATALTRFAQALAGPLRSLDE